MSREIKFRAWLSSEKRMMSNDEHLSFGSSLSYEEVFDSKSPLMQFTGLKDKNGVDIYEGDKLAPEGFKKLTRDHCEVYFYKGMFCLKPNGKLIQVHQPLYKSQELSAKAANDYVIVGNIYEKQSCI